MFVFRTYKVNGVDAFTLFLNVSFEQGNKLHSSIPMEFLQAHIPKVKQVKYAYLPERDMAGELLGELAEQIKRLSDSNLFYYPEYILCGGIMEAERAEYILNGILKKSIHVWPMTHYCQFNKPVDFFILRSLYIAERHLYHCSMRNMELADFKDYLVSTEMKLDFDRLFEDGCKAYVVEEDGEMCYLLLVTRTEELLMVISI